MTEKIREAIRLVSPDLVLLQEVMGQDLSSSTLEPHQNQLEFLADEVWPHFAYGKNSVYEEGDHGNAILSRNPIVDFFNENVSNYELEKRGILHSKIKSPEHGTTLHVITLHFDLFFWGRKKQLRRLIDRIQKEVPPNEPLLVGGDFNDWHEKISPVLESELGLIDAFYAVRGEPALTFPAFYPLLPLDRIYLRGLTPKNATTLSGEPWKALSDHAALLIEF